LLKFIDLKKGESLQWFPLFL